MEEVPVIQQMQMDQFIHKEILVFMEVEILMGEQVEQTVVAEIAPLNLGVQKDLVVVDLLATVQIVMGQQAGTLL